MIRLIFNGYYRSGTSFFYHILEESNPDVLALYEPLNPRLFSEMESEHSIFLHGFYAWNGYKTDYFRRVAPAYRRIHGRLVERFSGDILPFSIEDVKPLFDLLASGDKPVFLKTNRCHFILRDLSMKYDSKFIHIIRNPVDTWISMTLSILGKRFKVFQYIHNHRSSFAGRFLLKHLLPWIGWSGRQFFIEDDYRLLSNKFSLSYKSLDYLDKMLIVWTYSNYHGYVQSDDADGMCIYYEEVFRDPAKWFEIISNYSNLDIKRVFLKEVRPKTTVDYVLKEFIVERLENLGLMEMVDEFYPPGKWF